MPQEDCEANHFQANPLTKLPAVMTSLTNENRKSICFFFSVQTLKRLKLLCILFTAQKFKKFLWIAKNKKEGKEHMNGTYCIRNSIPYLAGSAARGVRVGVVNGSFGGGQRRRNGLLDWTDKKVTCC